jgi:prepilin-type N-terminal cleavage/methylation domain-containing protein/prepilin-type processing-associated H-X9-DG protein
MTRQHHSLFHRRTGFSLVELAVVLAILTILAGIFIPYFLRIRETDHRVRCADNLRAIMDGLRQYAMLKNTKGKETHDYPSVIYDPAHSGYVAYTGADAPDPFMPGGVKPNDVTASLWLLVRNGYVPVARFICPSSSNTPDSMMSGAGTIVSGKQRSNFTDGSHLSYSYASPFSSAPDYKMNEDSHAGDFAIMADKNPGVSGKNNSITEPAYNAKPFELAKANSNNHGKVGQNVLYADGHVSWQTTAYCGVGKGGRRDNIYTALSPIPLFPGQRPPVELNGYYGHNIGPSWTNDSYLVPTEDE